MPYPCNRCGRNVAPSPSSCCSSCYQKIDQEAERYAHETMRESDDILAEWRRSDSSKNSGCVLLVLAMAAPPIIFAVVQML